MTPSTPTTLAELVNFIIGLINQFIPLLIAITFLFIVWKLIDAWIIHADDETRRSDGKMIAFVGFVVVFIMISIWGILSFLQSTLAG